MTESPPRVTAVVVSFNTRDHLLRALAALVAVVNLLHSGVNAILVLFAADELWLGSSGYGLLLCGAAVGGSWGA